MYGELEDQAFGSLCEKHGYDVMGLGISTDEFMRAKDSRITGVTYEFPLLDLGLSRRDCLQVIAAAGLPEPPRSACFFCPYNSSLRWAALKRERPHLFDIAVQVEGRLSEKSVGRGYGPVTLRSDGGPLRGMATQGTFADAIGAECESGFCWT